MPSGEGQGLLDLGKVQKEFVGDKGPLWAERAGARESLGNGNSRQTNRFSLASVARNLIPLPESCHLIVVYPADLPVKPAITFICHLCKAWHSPLRLEHTTI